MTREPLTVGDGFRAAFGFFLFGVVVVVVLIIAWILFGAIALTTMGSLQR